MSRQRFAWIIGIALLAPLHAAGQDTFTPQHVAKLRAVVEAAVSPDGSQVAYVLAVPRNIPKEKDGGSWTELHVVDMKGTSTPFITGQVNVAAITWTVDGKSIAYLTKRESDTTRTLYAIPTRGGESRKLATHSTDIQSYSFSGDGKQVAFLATEPAPKSVKAQQDQGFSQEIYEEDQPLTRVWIATPDDGKPARMLKLEGSASELQWNPKQDKIAVALASNPLIDEHIMFRKVHIVDVKTGAATNLNNPGKMGQLAWSPDGKILALITGTDKHDPKEGRVWATTGESKDWTDVLPEFSGHVESIVWASRFELLVQASEGVETSLFPIDIATDLKAARLKNLISPGKIIVASPSASKNKVFAFLGNTAKHPSEVYVLAEKEGPPRRLTDSNPWLRTMQFAKQEVVKHKAKDGLELEGVLIRPLGEKKGDRYPLVVTVHGGPESHVANGWLTSYANLGQVGAARGMAVFYPNYRGSTGRGVEFSMKGQAAAAGKEFDDIVDGVDHLIIVGLVDDKKVGITGGSYGGYATAWGSTYYSHRFAAGVMFVGLSNLISCAGTTDIPQEMTLVHHRKWLWEDWDYFLKSSPVYHVEKSKTPLLILHGKADPRVHPAQSQELYRHLKVRGKAPVRLVLYPGEGHGNRRAASRLDYNLRMLQWMEHYLKGPGGAPPPHEIDYGVAPPATKTSSLGNQSWSRASGDGTYETALAVSRLWNGRGCPCCILP